MAIEVRYKWTRGLSMRVVKNGDVHVTAPIGMSRRDVQAFIDSHRAWIENARAKSSRRQERRAEFYSRLPLDTRARKIEAAKQLDTIVRPIAARYSEIMDVSPSAISYRPMISRWGVCKIKERSICLSTYLLLLPPELIEHVVVHELCHLIEPSHNARFHRLMDTYYPEWKRARRDTRRIVEAGAANRP